MPSIHSPPGLAVPRYSSAHPRLAAWSVRTWPPDDSDKLFPAYGFGAKLSDGRVHHMFNLNGQHDPHCHGIAGVMAAYNQAIQAVTLCVALLHPPFANARCYVLRA